MEKIIMKSLGALTLGSILFFMSAPVSSCTGGGGGSNDTSGNNPTPKYKIVTKKAVAAGSRIVLECDKCPAPSLKSASDSGSSDTSGPTGRPKALIICNTPFDIPENTELTVTFGDAAAR